MIKQQPITEVDVEMEEQSGVANSDAIDTP